MTASKDARALILSVVASSVFAVGSLIWGLLAGSQMIVFDGLYSFVSVALSLLAVWALRAARSGPDERYPWGREIFEPLDDHRQGDGVGGPVPVRDGRRGRRPA